MAAPASANEVDGESLPLEGGVHPLSQQCLDTLDALGYQFPVSRDRVHLGPAPNRVQADVVYVSPTSRQPGANIRDSWKSSAVLGEYHWESTKKGAERSALETKRMKEGLAGCKVRGKLAPCYF